jgi:RNA polymerase sigma-70 factor (ECF subfamily)
MDDAAVAEAFRTYGGAVYRRCLRILRDAEGARDVTQEVFVRCFDRRGRLRHGRELLGWLYRVATNLCLNALRDGKLRREVDRRLTPASPAATEPAEARLLWDLLGDLDERTQAIVVYVYIDGMTQAEAAEVAQVTDRTVRNCLARFQRTGRQRLGADHALPHREGLK